MEIGSMGDVFLEKIVKKKRSAVQRGLIIVVLIVALILCYALAFLFRVFGLIASILIAYGAYRLIASFNVEYEIAVTNNLVDIDKIINQTKRKSLFSGDCKDFELVAKKDSDKYTQSYDNIPQKIMAISSTESEDIYFILTDNDKGRLIIYFEPDQRMLETMRKYIPSKVFI